MPELSNGCLFCGGNADEPNHAAHCDGRQGQVEATIPDEPTIAYEPLGHVRTSDPDTSHEAASINELGKKTQCRMIYGIINARILGATCAEIVTATGWEHQSVSRRITDICQQGFVRDSGTRRPNPRSGRRQIVWVAVAS